MMGDTGGHTRSTYRDFGVRPCSTECQEPPSDIDPVEPPSDIDPVDVRKSTQKTPGRLVYSAGRSG